MVRDREKLSWKEWGERVDRYLEHVVFLFSPDLFIVGGGVSRKADKWLQYVDVDAEIAVATLENEAGIVGAASIAEQATTRLKPTALPPARAARLHAWRRQRRLAGAP